jgi:pyrimidine operon attenuation protein/uracil phosphoribosyltransferase
MTHPAAVNSFGNAIFVRTNRLMQKRLLFNSHLLDITIDRLCQQLIENHDTFEGSVILGMQPRGVFLADRIGQKLKNLTGRAVPAGRLDTTFFRDDFRRRESPLTPNTTSVPFIIEEKKVVLIDDVLFTGRTVRAALDAMIAFGRPKKVELLVLIDRKYSRELPIEPFYVGRQVNTILSQRVLVEWKEQGAAEDAIWLIH